MTRREAIVVTFPRVFFREVSSAQFVRQFYGMNRDPDAYWPAGA